MNLSLGLTKEWCIPPEQMLHLFAGWKMFLETYKQAYDPHILLFAWMNQIMQHEKAKIKGTSAKPGKLERFDTSYEKNGVSNILSEPLSL